MVQLDIIWVLDLSKWMWVHDRWFPTMFRIPQKHFGIQNKRRGLPSFGGSSLYLGLSFNGSYFSPMFYILKMFGIDFQKWQLSGILGRNVKAYSQTFLHRDIFHIHIGSLVVQTVKRLPTMRKTWVRSPGGEDPLRRKWQPTPVLLPRKLHGWRILVGYSLWGRKELDMTEQVHFLSYTHIYICRYSDWKWKSVCCVWLLVTPWTIAC